jgi:hypothetical protein
LLANWCRCINVRTYYRSAAPLGYRGTEDGREACFSHCNCFRLQLSPLLCACSTGRCSDLLISFCHLDPRLLIQGDAVTNPRCLPPFPSRQLASAAAFHVKLPSGSQPNILDSLARRGLYRAGQAYFGPVCLLPQLLPSGVRFPLWYLANSPIGMTPSTRNR